MVRARLSDVVVTTSQKLRFSFQLGTTVWDSYTWATFSVALDVSKWVMLSFAALAWRDHKLRSAAAVAIWIVATVYSFTAAIGFAALWLKAHGLWTPRTTRSGFPKP